MDIRYLLYCFIQTVISTKNPKPPVQDAKGYVDRCITMARKIDEAIDIDQLKPLTDKNLQFLVEFDKYERNQSSRDAQEKENFMKKVEQENIYMTELHEILEKIGNAALEFYIEICDEDLKFYCIDVLDVMYHAMKIKLSYIETVLDSYDKLKRIMQNPKSESMIFVKKPNVNTDNLAAWNKVAQEEILARWICNVSKLKFKSKTIGQKYSKLNDSGDYTSIVFDGSVVESSKLDLHYGYTVLFNEFMTTICKITNGKEQLINQTLSERFYLGLIQDVLNFTNQESQFVLLAFSKYSLILKSHPKKKDYEHKFLAWHQDSAKRYRALQSAIMTIYAFFVKMYEEFEADKVKECLKGTQILIISMRNAQSQILYLMGKQPNIAKPKENEDSFGGSEITIFVLGGALIFCIIYIIRLSKRNK